MVYPSSSYCVKEKTQRRVVVSTKVKGASKTRRLALMTLCIQILEMPKKKKKKKKLIKVIGKM
jgi:hypothetical protein